MKISVIAGESPQMFEAPTHGGLRDCWCSARAEFVAHLLQALTVNGAYEFYAEVSKGALESGKPADFVVLDKNPVKIKPMTRKHIRVVETIKDGKRVYQATP